MALTQTGTDGIKDDAVTLDKLAHGTSGQDGKFLRANNGAAPSFESIPAGITINNQADNRLITATGTTDTLNSESNVTINSDGDLLVGRTSTIDASEVFGIKGPDSEHCSLGIITDGTTNLGIIAFNDDDGTFRGRVQYDHNTDSMQLRTAGTERLRLDSAGNVGIGTSSPNSFTNYKTLTIQGGTAGAGIDLELSSGDIHGRFFGDTNGVQIQSTQAGDSIRFETAGANERMRITDTGKVGINETSPQQQLHVHEDTIYNGILINGNAAPRVGFARSTTTTGEWSVGIDGTNGNNFAINSSNDNQNNKIIIDSSSVQLVAGNVTVPNGNVVMGATRGIDFSANTNTSISGTGTSSELLDHYEEGTWTPVIGGWDTFTPYSGSTYNYGWYTRVGTIVHCGWKIYIQSLSTVSSSAQINIQGLPFNSSSVHAGIVAHVRFDIPEFGFEGYPLAYLAGSSNLIYMNKHVDGGNHLVSIDATANRSGVWTMGTATYTTS